jgi:hypothetical protein
MATGYTDDQHYQDIADAIRAKGVSGEFTPAQMAEAIGDIGAGGGTSNWTLIKSATLFVNTTSTSGGTAGTVECGSAAWTDKNVVLWVHIRGQSGKRSGYFYGSDAFFFNYRAANGSTVANTITNAMCICVDSNGRYLCTSGQYGVYGFGITSSGTLTIRRRYNSASSLTINDTFDIEVYTLTMPTGVKLLD